MKKDTIGKREVVADKEEKDEEELPVLLLAGAAGVHANRSKRATGIMKCFM